MKNPSILSWLSLLPACGMLGCNAGAVTMSAAAPAVQNTPTSAPARSSSTPTAGDEDSVVYFDRVSVRDSLPETIIGLGFLRENARTQNAFGLRFKTTGGFSSRPLLSAGRGGVTYIKPDGLGHERVLQLDPRTLSDSQLALLPGGVKAVALSDDRRSLAWIDSSNQVIASLNGAPAVPFSFEGGLPGFLSFSPESDELNVSPAGRPFVRALQKSAEGTLAKIVEQPDGTLALIATTSESGETTEIALLTIPASAPVDRIVCPVWYGNTLYFADASNSSYTIFSATQAGGVWTVQAFARTGSPNQGFTCPQVSANPVNPRGGL